MFKYTNFLQYKLKFVMILTINKKYVKIIRVIYEQGGYK